MIDDNISDIYCYILFIVILTYIAHGYLLPRYQSSIGKKFHISKIDLILIKMDKITLPNI